MNRSSRVTTRDFTSIKERALALAHCRTVFVMTDPSMQPNPANLHSLTRRHLFGQCAMGLGSLALASLMADKGLAGTTEGPAPVGPKIDLADPLAPRQGHYPAKARNVIYLFMAGGPSQLELFDYKPKLVELNGQQIPESYVAGRRFAFMSSFAGKERPRLLGTRRKFARHGKVGAWVSECFPYTAQIVDDITLVHTVGTEVFNHAPAKLFMNTGSAQSGRPSMGAWITYGIGSECHDLPGFVVLQSGPRGPRGGAVNWGSGFLPTAYQGVPFRGSGDPIVDLASPSGVDSARQRRTIDAIGDLNRERREATGDAEIDTRIAAYEMAYRMQTSAPELIDLKGESQATLDLYGVKE